jgi:DNA-binding transcriptional LysR family regulator
MYPVASLHDATDENSFGTLLQYLDRLGEPRTIEDLDRHEFVDYIDDFVSISQVRWLHDVLVPSRVVFRSSSMVAQHNAAAAGVGMVLLPSFSAAEDARLRPVLIDQASVMRSIWLTLHEDHQYLSRIKAVKSFLKKIISADQPFLNGSTIP